MVSGCYVWKCQTSPGRAGEGVDVKLARNGVVFARSAEGFMYDPVPAVESLVPSSGPFQHGFVLTVLGYHFLDGAHAKDQAVVRVGGDTFHGRVRSSSLLHCLVTARYPGNHSVEMSTNGVDFTEVRSRILIHEDFSVRAVHQISPSLGPSAGGMSVILRIERMAEDQWAGTERRCFGNLAVVATALDEWTVSCITPRLVQGMERIRSTLEAPGRYVVNATLVLSGSDCPESESGAVAYVYTVTKAAFKISSVSPSFGSIRGGTPVTVTGTGYTEWTDLQCVFGDETSPSVMIAAAGVGQEPGQVLVCISPAVAIAGKVSVTVSSRGGLGLDGQAAFYVFEPAASLHAVLVTAPTQPTEPVLLTVIGSHFSNVLDLVCQVGLGRASAARWLSSTVLLCVVPDSVLFVTNKSSSGNLSVEVSNNGADFSETKGSITLCQSMWTNAVQHASHSVSESAASTVLVDGDSASNPRIAFPSAYKLWVCFLGVEKSDEIR